MDPSGEVGRIKEGGGVVIEIGIEAKGWSRISLRAGAARRFACMHNDHCHCLNSAVLD